MIIYVIKNDAWRSRPKAQGQGAYLIDLRKCHSNADVICTLGIILRGKQSTPICEDSNLSGLADVMFDFFVENWGYKKDITVLGIGSASARDPMFVASLMACISATYISGAEATLRTEAETTLADDTDKTVITYVWN